MSLLPVPKKWNAEADVIVVGAGNAGLPAAIAATDKGAKVLILEAWGSPCSSLALIAGGTPFVGTDLQKEAGIKDSPEKVLKEAVEISGGSPELYGVLMARQLDTYEWLKTMGAKPIRLFNAPGHSEIRLHRFQGHGAGILKALIKAVQTRGIETYFKHRADRLIVDPVTGRVIGVRAKNEDKDVYFKANKAVILANGGFIRNKEMITEYGPTFLECVPVSPVTHMGDGLRMVLDIGGATSGIGVAVCPSISVCTTTNRTTVITDHGAIAVNQAGQRWWDEMCTESGTYSPRFREILRQDPHGGLHFNIYDSYIRQETSPEAYQHVKEFKADTLEELAEAAGIDPAGLVKTIEEYNSDIKKYAYDTKFGRKAWGGLHGKEPPPKVEKPPFYAIKCKVSISSLKGGVKINTRAQVVDNFDKPIPGLYAAGEVAGGFCGKPDAYYAGVMTLQGFVFGRVAGENAAIEG
jgi:fumarate reductase flavoprotein subunit